MPYSTTGRPAENVAYKVQNTVGVNIRFKFRFSELVFTILTIIVKINLQKRIFHILLFLWKFQIIKNIFSGDGLTSLPLLDVPAVHCIYQSIVNNFHYFLYKIVGFFLLFCRSPVTILFKFRKCKYCFCRRLSKIIYFNLLFSLYVIILNNLCMFLYSLNLRVF